MSTPAARYAEAANYRLDAGGRDTGERPGAIVLLHGLGGDLAQLWDVTGPQVGGRPVAKLAPDARLHGETELADTEELTFPLLADDVLGLVDRLGLGPRLVLVGVSMGAATALRFALGSPGRVRALVLVRPAWTSAPEAANLAIFGEIAALLRDVGPQEGAARFAASPGYQDIAAISPSAAASLLEQFTKRSALERVRRLEDLPRSVPYADPAELGAITAPTLVIGAPTDPVHPLAIAEELAGLITGATLSVLTARDLAPEQNRADLEAAVEGFLTQVHLDATGELGDEEGPFDAAEPQPPGRRP
ncbi:MAG: hypothetical protein JWM85_1912 [Acidimicrobiaceae bacterium]|nr:hypothetical protein [Acidimicrobiaceae bacterium]